MSGNIKNVIFSFLFFIPGICMTAQPQVSVYTDMGMNSVSDGLFVKTAGLARYQFEKYKVEAGLQMDIRSYNENIFSGYSLKASRDLMIKDFPVELQGFYVWTQFSDVLRETNFGMLANFKRNRFTIRAGTNFRTYAFTQKAVRLYELDESAKIHENWNLMYSFSYYLKPLDNQWNIGLAITNIDHFIINQETNPVFCLSADYRVSLPVNLFAECWYKSAGAFNLNVNYFGFFFRTGIIWYIN